ncbi:hypothetical protein [Chryseobacterium sp. 22543]|uniref:hypothetical protein n=1 Tax=Chryseobacterium sp. 22543 TaxID=3453940 RepID=UPI003F84BAA9
MKRFITYFDLLGYRNFLMNNNSELHHRVITQMYTHIDSALNETGKYKQLPNGNFVNDLTNKTVSFANYSDTIILWTEGDSQEEFNSILNATYECNWRMNGFHFPVRGVLIYDELFDMNYTGTEGGYHINTFYGKGLIHAHDKAESQQWAGMFLDKSVFDKVEIDDNILEKCINYTVPFKAHNSEELAFRLRQGVNEESFKNSSIHTEENFKRHNKWEDIPTLKEKLYNTIEFLKFLIDK